MLRKYRSLRACKSCKYYTNGAKFPVSVKDARLSQLFPLRIRGKFRITVLFNWIQSSNLDYIRILVVGFRFF